MIYIILGGFLFFLTLLESGRQFRKIAEAGCYLALAMMIGLAALRNNVGTDWDAYLNFYRNTEESARLEPGYSLFNDFFSHLGIHYNAFLLALNVVCVGLIASFFKQSRAFCAAAILTFYSDLFLYFNLSGMRQAIAIAITCFSLRYAIEKKAIPFFSLVAMAATFHMSAVVFAASYFIPRGRLKWHHATFICLIGVVFYQLLEPIAQLVTEYTIKNASYYIDGIEIQDDVVASYHIGIAKRLMVLGIVFLTRKSLARTLYFSYLLNLYLVGVGIYVLTYVVSADIGVRMSAYFTIIDTVFIGLAIRYEESALTRFFIAALVCAMSLYKLIGYANNPFYDYKIFL